MVFMTPQERYQRDLRREDFSPDPAQRVAIRQAQRLFDGLLASTPSAKGSARSLWTFRRGGASAKITPLKGIYFWGGVGRGKTHVMDTLFDHSTGAGACRALSSARLAAWKRCKLTHISPKNIFPKFIPRALATGLHAPVVAKSN